MTTNEQGWQDPDAEDFDEDGDSHDVGEVDGGDDLERSSGGALRQKYVEALGRIKELEAADEVKTEAIKGKSLDDAFAANGLRRDEGIGKAIALGYEGEADADELAAHLETEYGYVWTGEPHPMVEEIKLAQAQLDQIGQGSGSVPVEEPWQQKLAEAEAKGDHGTSLAMKSDQLINQLRNQ